MKIGLCTDTLLPIVDGVGRVVHQYALTLSDMGHECYVITPMADTGYRGGYPFELVDFCSASLPRSPQYKMGIPIWDHHYNERMKHIKLDILHAHSPFIAGQEAIRLSNKRKIPLIGTFHSKYYDDFLKITKQEHLAQLGVKFVVDFYQKCDEVWAVSKTTADVLWDYGYTGTIQVMPNGAQIRAPQKGLEAKINGLFALDDSQILLYVGQMNWKKNILLILKACALLKNEGVRFKLVMAGQGPDSDDIKEKAAELGLEQSIVFTGHISQMEALDGLYQRASLFVFPSLYDNAPMVVREAAIMGTPSILARGSSAAEVIEDGKNGLLCGDAPEDLCRVIKNALADPDLISALGENAKNTIPVSWYDIISDVAVRYEQLIENYQSAQAIGARMLD